MEERKDSDIEMEVKEEEETQVEDTEIEEEEELSAQKIKKLKDKLRESEQQKMTALEDLARARADFLNAKKRLDEEKINDRERIKLQYIEDILPLCDSFSMALADPAFQALPENLKKGVLGINGQLSSILRSYGVEEFGQVGEEFNPNIHEALADNGGEHNISEVLSKGYRIGEKLIRPAKVIVGNVAKQ